MCRLSEYGKLVFLEKFGHLVFLVGCLIAFILICSGIILLGKTIDGHEVPLYVFKLGMTFWVGLVVMLLWWILRLLKSFVYFMKDNIECD